MNAITERRVPADSLTCTDEVIGMDRLFAHHFGRVEPRRPASAFISTLSARLPRVNCWTAAEHAGHQSPDALGTLWVGSFGHR